MHRFKSALSGVILFWIVAGCSNATDKKDSLPKEEILPYDTMCGTKAKAKSDNAGTFSSVTNREHFHTVEIKGMKFIPAELTVAKGDTVEWINHDITTHDVTEQPTKAWTSSPIEAGKSWRMVVKKSSDYFCSIHVVMTGKIILK